MNETGMPEFVTTDDVSMRAITLDSLEQAGINAVFCPIDGHERPIYYCRYNCPCCLEAVYTKDADESQRVCGFTYKQLMSDRLVDIARELKAINSNITRLEYVISHQGD